VGKDAQGEVSVRVGGRDSVTVMGQGLSTDVIEASVEAYLDAVNKILYQAQASKKKRVSCGV